jgi:hypothetical protein
VDDLEEANGLAVLALHEQPGHLAGCVSWSGEQVLIPFVVPAMLDKLLANLWLERRSREGLLATIENWVHQAQVLTSQNNLPTLAEVVEIREHIAGDPSAEITVSVHYNLERQRLGATTRWSRKRIPGTDVPQVALWTLWDWTCAVLRDYEPSSTPRLQLLATQCRLYRMHGFPSIRQIGRAPFRALVIESGTVAAEPQ